MKRALVVTVAAIGLAVGVSAGTAAPRIDFATVALNVLPPSEAGDLGTGRHSVDQIALYDDALARRRAPGANAVRGRPAAADDALRKPPSVPAGIHLRRPSRPMISAVAKASPGW